MKLRNILNGIVILVVVFLFTGCTSKVTLNVPKNRMNNDIVEIDTIIDDYYSCYGSDINLYQGKNDKKSFLVSLY